MSIVATDIQFFKSSNPNSDGGVITPTQIVDAVLNNLFPDTTGDQAATGNTTYRKVFVKNNHGTLTWQDVKFWIEAQVQSDETIGIALGTPTDTDGTAPTYVFPSDKSTAIAIGDLVPFGEQGLWVRRVTPAGSTAFPNASSRLKLEGDSL